jgi:hypothetical protein
MGTFKEFYILPIINQNYSGISMKITSYSPSSFLVAMVAIIGNFKPAIAQKPTDEIIEIMTGIGQQVISQIEQTPCQNFSSSTSENHLTESQNAFKEQIATQFVSVFQRLLQDVPSSPEIFRQTSSLMLNKLSECAFKSPRY